MLLVVIYLFLIVTSSFFIPFRLVLSAKLEGLEDSVGAEDVISLSDIVPNVNKCSVSIENHST